MRPCAQPRTTDLTTTTHSTLLFSQMISGAKMNKSWLLLIALHSVVLVARAQLGTEWISGGTLLRSKPFSMKPGRVLLSVSAVGCYSLRVNGERPEQTQHGYLAPGFSTVPSLRMLYEEVGELVFRAAVVAGYVRARQLKSHGYRCATQTSPPSSIPTRTVT